MGWERRHGRWYLYRCYREGGRPVKEYLGCQDPWGFGEVAADAAASTGDQGDGTSHLRTPGSLADACP